MVITKIHINSKEFDELRRSAKEEGILFSKETQMFGLYLGPKIIGCCGLLIRSSSAVIKCAFVLPSYRGNDYLAKMIEARMQYLRQYHPKVKTATANCTKMAVKTHLRYGAKVVEKYKNGITKLVYENI